MSSLKSRCCLKTLTRPSIVLIRTGVYLYSTFTKREIVEERDLAFECRQFPRSSGYPEDPATRQIMSYSESRGDNYDILQGTAMGRPSKIQVEIGNYSLEGTIPNPSLKISYTGLVVFDAVSFSDLA